MLFFGLMAVIPGRADLRRVGPVPSPRASRAGSTCASKALESGLALGSQRARCAVGRSHGQGAGCRAGGGRLSGTPAARTAQPHARAGRFRNHRPLHPVRPADRQRGQQPRHAHTALPTPTQLQQVRAGRVSAPSGRGRRPLRPRTGTRAGAQAGGEPRVLQLTHAVPAGSHRMPKRCRRSTRDYQELSLARQGLTQIYALTLTLAVLLALFAAFALAFVMARRLVGAAFHPRRRHAGRGSRRLHTASGNLQSR